MAHFINAKGSRISNSIQQAGVGASVTIGVWGAAGLTVGPNDRSIATIKPLGPDSKNNTWFSLTGVRVGNVMVEAKQGAAVWDFFQLAVGAVAASGVAAGRVEPNADGRYTTHPQEVQTRATKTTPAALMPLFATLATLNDTGRRSLIAQHMHETGGGKSCYNWNLGNVRTKSVDEPHMYLRDVPEDLSPSAAQAAVEAGKHDGTARYPTAEEKKKRNAATGRVIVIFNPPGEGARFKAFGGLIEGGQGLLAKHRSVGAKNSDYFPALNRGDFDTIARILKQANYYLGPEVDYAKRMKEWRVVIDRQLG